MKPPHPDVGREILRMLGPVNQPAPGTASPVASLLTQLSEFAGLDLRTAPAEADLARPNRCQAHPKCPVLPGEAVAETVAVGGGLWLKNDFRYSLEATSFRQVSLSETLESLKAALADRYVLERELGRGGMATVYLARDVRHDRPVALKVLHPELAHALGPERFSREIRLAARLDHPHILSVHDSGETAGRLWFTMPYVEGESLRNRLAREPQLRWWMRCGSPGRWPTRWDMPSGRASSIATSSRRTSCSRASDACSPTSAFGFGS